jgi:hypothetical protein
MSYRAVISIAAAAMLGIACASTDAMARGGGRGGFRGDHFGGFHNGAHGAAFHGGAHVGGFYGRGYGGYAGRNLGMGVGVGAGAAAIGAALLQQHRMRSLSEPAVLIWPRRSGERRRSRSRSFG